MPAIKVVIILFYSFPQNYIKEYHYQLWVFFAKSVKKCFLISWKLWDTNYRVYYYRIIAHSVCRLFYSPTLAGQNPKFKINLNSRYKIQRFVMRNKQAQMLNRKTQNYMLKLKTKSASWRIRNPRSCHSWIKFRTGSDESQDLTDSESSSEWR